MREDDFCHIHLFKAHKPQNSYISYIIFVFFYCKIMHFLIGRFYPLLNFQCSTSTPPPPPPPPLRVLLNTQLCCFESNIDCPIFGSMTNQQTMTFCQFMTFYQSMTFCQSKTFFQSMTFYLSMTFCQSTTFCQSMTLCKSMTFFLHKGESSIVSLLPDIRIILPSCGKRT